MVRRSSVTGRRILSGLTSYFRLTIFNFLQPLLFRRRIPGLDQPKDRIGRYGRRTTLFCTRLGMTFEKVTLQKMVTLIKVVGLRVGRTYTGTAKRTLSPRLWWRHATLGWKNFIKKKTPRVACRPSKHRQLEEMLGAIPVGRY